MPHVPGAFFANLRLGTGLDVERDLDAGLRDAGTDGS